MRILFALLIISLSTASAIAQDYIVPKTEGGIPNLHGVWKHATIMPLERPVELGEKRAYTEGEALKN